MIVINNYLYKHEIEENLKVGLLDILILKLISEEDSMYGYKIKLTMAERSGGAITLPEGSLYGPLYRMEKRGYISPRKVFVGQTRYRIYYSITEKGKGFLAEALECFDNIYNAARSVIGK